MAGIAGFKVQLFQNPGDLAKFVATSVTTVYAIVYDTNSVYVLFYA